LIQSTGAVFIDLSTNEVATFVNFDSAGFKKYRSLTILTCDQSKASNILSFCVLIKSNFEEIANANLAFFIDKIFALKE
jgi:hypothetical protein